MGIGTSTGGLLCAAYLGQKNDQPLFKASTLSDFWKDKIGEVFRNHTWLARLFPLSDGIFWVKYSADGLEKVIGEIADDTMDIKANMSAPTIFTSYDAKVGKPFYFRSTDVENSLDKTIYKVKSVLRCTTAAPGYLPAAKITIDQEDHAFLDGGLANNNPSLIGYIEAQNLAGSRPIQVLSFGTGEVDYTVSYNRIARAGFLGVAPVVFNAFFAAMENHPTQELSKTLKDNFHRFQVYGLPSEHSGLDDVSSVPYLEEVAREWIEKNNDLLETVASSLKPKLDPSDPYAKTIEF
jgi:hypothetical protein